MTRQASAPAAPQASLREVTRVFARIGLISFGGPAGQIALMHRTLVDEKRWLSEERFLHALNYCMFLPGPEAMQLATYAGWLMQGVRGGLVAGILFLLPGALAVVALSALYLFANDLLLVAGLFFGIKAAVLAVVVEALLRIGRRSLKTRSAVVMAMLAFAALAVFQVPFPVIVIAAAACGAALSRTRRKLDPSEAAETVDPVLPAWTRPSTTRLLQTLGAWLLVWIGPLLMLRLLLPGNTLTDAANFFSVMAVVTFGGAYAVLAYVGQQAVELYGWLKPDEMLTGLGLAETTPGPLILVLVFIGFLGGARSSGFEPVIGGLAGAGVALWFTFVPCFLWIFVGAPYMERLRKVRWLSDALSAVSAAVVGIIASLAVWFGLHVLFRELDPVALGPISLSLPRLLSFDPAAAIIAAGAGVALLWLKWPIVLVLGLSAVAGALLAI